MNDLRVSLVQGDTRWHDPAGNRSYYGGLMSALRGITDLVLLPETFTSGFSNDAIGSAETMDGPTVAWMREQALGRNARLTARLPEDAADLDVGFDIRSGNFRIGASYRGLVSSRWSDHGAQVTLGFDF